MLHVEAVAGPPQSSVLALYTVETLHVETVASHPHSMFCTGEHICRVCNLYKDVVNGSLAIDWEAIHSK